MKLRCTKMVPFFEPPCVVYWSYHVKDRICTTSFRRPISADDRNMIGAISRKALRHGITHTAFNIEEIIDSVDRKLFTRITHYGHCLHHLLPPKTSAYCPYSLRKRKHSYQLPHIEFSQYKTVLSIDVCLDSDD